MGIVKISEQVHEALRRTSAALSRSINSQAEHWLRVGMLAELNPTLSYGQICQILIQEEVAHGTPEALSPLTNPSKVA
ncbi:ParD-like family protein [Aromatoleum toluclasticum]|uniref:ParD-like family protein n=1 Tax=Aromatoleum toluclasticum TaxID=92003 RepID=UPI000370F5F2|nr:ParD-like family protein [Aromatoleum toluclasticum]